VANVVQANIKSAVTPGIKCEIFNVACGKAYSVLDIVKYVNKILGKDIKPLLGPIRAGDAKHTLADISKIKKLIGFKPEVGFEDGLKKTIEYFRGVK
jgi:nucleoside-diphosphate-sugar epimerase